MTDSLNQDFEELVKMLQSSPHRALIQPLTEALQNKDNDPARNVELERALKRITDKK